MNRVECDPFHARGAEINQLPTALKKAEERAAEHMFADHTKYYERNKSN